jgi:hypothetical protein
MEGCRSDPADILPGFPGDFELFPGSRPGRTIDHACLRASIGSNGMGAATAPGWSSAVQPSPFLRESLRPGSSESRHPFQSPAPRSGCSEVLECQSRAPLMLRSNGFGVVGPTHVGIGGPTPMCRALGRTRQRTDTFIDGRPGYAGRGRSALTGTTSATRSAQRPWRSKGAYVYRSWAAIRPAACRTAVPFL